jgi:hypothetical protein
MPNQIIGLPEFSSVLFQIVMAAFIVERALALIFEWDVWDFLVKHAPWLNGAKEVIAFAASYTICQTANFDALKTLFNSNPSEIGKVITALVIAGGSKGAMKLMQDVWKIKNVPTDDTSSVAAAVIAPQPRALVTAPPATGAGIEPSSARAGSLN